MNTKYPNSGAIFPRQKRNPKAADFSGDVTIEGDVMDYIVRCAERNEECKLDISAWKRQTNSGGTMLSMKVETPYSERGGGRQQERQPIRTSQGTYRSGGRQNDQRDDYQPRQDYGRGNPRHDTSMGGSQRDDRRTPPPRRDQRDFDNRGGDQRDFPYDDMNDPLGDL